MKYSINIDNWVILNKYIIIYEWMKKERKKESGREEKRKRKFIYVIRSNILGFSNIMGGG